jgi:hypothetical protein
VPCKACGYAPSGEDRQVAWLFSEHHLSPEELAFAAVRVRRGDRPDPATTLKELAREAMGALPPPLPEGAREPLALGAIVALTAANLLLTPLTGVAVWLGLRDDRPAAARQALLFTMPVALGVGVLWAAVLVAGLYG